MNRLLVGLCLLSLWCVEAHAARHAVLIGTTYNDCDASADGVCIRPLRGPHNDVAALRTVLTERYGFAADRVTTLTGGAATKAAIMGALKGLAQTTEPGDLLFIYFSGHGTSGFDQSTSATAGIEPTSGAIVPHDARIYEDDPQRTLDGLIIGRRDLRPVFEDLERERSLVVVFDACYSGNSVRSLGRSPGIAKYTPLPPLPYTGTPREPYPYRNLLYISASSATEIAKDLPAGQAQYDGQAHGALTDGLLVGLTGAANTNHNDVITYQELYEFVRSHTSNAAGHTPQLLVPDEAAKTRAVFEAPPASRPSRPAPAPSGRVRLHLDGADLAALRPRLEALAGLELSATDPSLRLSREGGAYVLWLANGDQLWSTPEASEVVERVARYVAGRELVELRSPDQPFNVWMRVGDDNGRTTFFIGESLTLTLRSERAAQLVIVNIDPEGYVNAVALSIGQDQDLALGEIGHIEPPLGTEYLKVFAFPQPVSGLGRLTFRAILEPHDPAVQEFVQRVKQATGWATTRREVVSVPQRP